MSNPPGPGQPWNILDLVRWGESYFREKGFSTPRLEIEYLLTALLNYQRVDLYLHFDEPVSTAQLATLKGWIQRRLTREPLQYITGNTEFYGRVFQVEPPVLIPRPETERVVEQALKLLKTMETPTVLDVGTGSGCIALTLALEIPALPVTALDPSEKALRLAQKNARRLGAGVNWVGAPFSDYHPAEPFDMIVSNPPYVTAEEFESLTPDVRNYEDAHALTDQADGLTLTRELARRGTHLLKPGGWIVLEVGRQPQPEKAREFFLSLDYAQVELRPDYNGDDRVLIAQRR